MHVKSIKQSDLNDRLLFWSFCSTFFFLPVATSPAVISGLISLGVWIFSGKIVRDRNDWSGQSWFKPVILFMLLPWFGLLWSNDINIGLEFAKKSYYWLYAFAILSLGHIYYPNILIKSFLSGLSLTVFISISQYIGIISMTNVYQAGFMGHITYSLLLVFGILLLSFYYREAKLNKHRVAILILIAVYVFSLSINMGRIGYFAFVFLSPWILFNILGRKNILLIVAALCTLIVILSLSRTVQDRTKLAVEEINAYYSGSKNTSVGRRLYMWEGAFKMILENPLLGVGTGGYQRALAQYRDDPSLPDIIHPHNTFLYVASSYGIVGLLSFSWLFIIFLKKGWSARETIEGFASLSYGAVLLIGSLTDTQILSVSTGILFALLTGLRTKQNE